jgi:hypothetical protein
MTEQDDSRRLTNAQTGFVTLLVFIGRHESKAEFATVGRSK